METANIGLDSSFGRAQVTLSITKHRIIELKIKLHMTICQQTNQVTFFISGHLNNVITLYILTYVNGVNKHSYLVSTMQINENLLQYDIAKSWDKKNHGTMHVNSIFTFKSEYH